MSDKKGFQVDIGFILLVLGSVVWAWIGLDTLRDNWGKEFNNVGDFLAGWFAPLAFMWFIYTAIMQKIELNLTRQVAEEQAKALDGQLKTLTANNVIEAIKSCDFSEKRNEVLTFDAMLTRIDHQVRGLDPQEKFYHLHEIYKNGLNLDGLEDRFPLVDGKLCRSIIQAQSFGLKAFSKELYILASVNQEQLNDHALINSFLSVELWKKLRASTNCMNSLLHFYNQYQSYHDNMIQEHIRAEKAANKL